MARIFDNIEQDLLEALKATLKVSKRADFCVGYLNLRGWQAIDEEIASWDPHQDQVCRVLVGMQRPPHDEIRELYRLGDQAALIDNATAARLKLQFAAHLREQIVLGIPTGQDEKGLRRLASQLRAGQVIVKLFLPYPLHAKLYLLFRDDSNNPITGFVGSSNLTMAGLSRHGELNVDVLDHLGTEKLSKWFEDRWNERWALDVSADLAQIIETSWAREEPIPPHHIYLNMAYHLSTEARAGLSQFRLPGRFESELFEFQKSAVKIAARHLQRRGGVMIGDVVGLGKTMMATALARLFEDDYGYETLILCPKNLEPMWERYRTEYGLRGMVLPVSLATKKLPDLKRYKLVLIDESYRMAFRDVGRNTDIRTVISTILPPKRFCPHTVSLEQVFTDVVISDAGEHMSVSQLDDAQRLVVMSLFNSYVFDWFIRQSVTAHVSFFFVYNTPVPRMSAADPAFTQITTRAARLICITPEFDDLAKAVGLQPKPSTSSGRTGGSRATEYGETDPHERAKLRAELDGLVAHLYGLTEAEFAHILATFPLVPEPVKQAARNAYRDVDRGLIP